jgi:hypothetical protein
MAKVKITDVKRVLHQGLIDPYLKKERFPNGLGICPLVEGWAAV